jgi:hypothetical protein
VSLSLKNFPNPTFKFKFVQFLGYDESLPNFVGEIGAGQSYDGQSNLGPANSRGLQQGRKSYSPIHVRQRNAQPIIK